MTKPVTPEQFHAAGDAFLDTWRGVAFQWDGRTLQGVDCWGLVAAFYLAVYGVALPDWARGEQSRSWVVRAIAGNGTSHWCGLYGPQDGAIAKARGHVGICWRGGVLHAAEGRGVIWENLATFLLQHPGAEFGTWQP